MTGLISFVAITDVYGLTKPFNGKSTVKTKEGLIVAYILLVALFVPIIYSWITYKVIQKEKSNLLIYH